MPIYEYVCEKCGDHLEVIQKVGDEPLKRCKKCRGKLEKIISRTSFQLKGSGWYASDYAGKSQKSESKTDSAKSDTKSDAKPDAKSDAKSSTNDTTAAD